MPIYSMGVSADGFIADREAGSSGPPRTRSCSASTRAGERVGGYLLGRRLYETMLVWETDPSMRANERGAAFADLWCALPNVMKR